MERYELLYWLLAGLALGAAAHLAYDHYLHRPGHRHCIEWSDG